jgi:Ca-activated chloride channel family protein
MNLTNPKLFILFLLLLPLIWGIVMLKKRYTKRFSSFAEDQLQGHYQQGISFFFYRLKAVLLLLALSCLIIAVVRPQWDREPQDIARTGMDIVICIDVSKSMDATDFQPTRLQRAKDQISAFIDEQKGDRIALLPFAGVAAVQCPLTDDYEAARMLLQSLTTNSIPVWGTDIGAALTTAGQIFDKNTKSRIVILISDGEDLGDASLKAAKELAAQGVIIYTLGVGTPQGAKLQLSSEEGFDGKEQQNIVTKLDNQALTRLAASTGGQFYMVTPTQDEIAAILKHISGLEKSRLSTKHMSLFKEQFHLFAIAALLLLLAESLLSIRATRIDKTSSTFNNESGWISLSPAMIMTLFLGLIILIIPLINLHAIDFPWSKALQNSKGSTSYNKQDYQKAETIYRKNSLTHPKDKTLQYNHGNALYKLKKDSDAAKAYTSATSSKDKKLQSQAWHNLGNLQYNQKQYEQAMQSYRKAIQANPDSQPARANYELAKRMLIKQQQQQNKQNQQQNKDKPKDNKEKQKPQQPKQDKQQQDEKQKAADRILKALEQKEVNDRKDRQTPPQRIQNNKWW